MRTPKRAIRGRRRNRKGYCVPAYITAAPHRRPGALYPPKPGRCRVCNEVVDISRTKRKRSWHDGRDGEPTCLSDWKFRTRPNLAKRLLAKERGCKCEHCGRTGPRGERPTRIGAQDYKWLHLDHVIPLADLPLDDRQKFDRHNLQLLCEEDHKAKTAAEAAARAKRRRAASAEINATNRSTRDSAILIAC